MQPPLETQRLLIRDWTVDDAEAALSIYGEADVADWLTPEMHEIPDVTSMRAVLQAWVEAQPNLVPPSGRWAVVRRDDDELVGGLGIRLLPPYEEDLEIGWHIRPDSWGRGYATEASHALMAWAFEQGTLEELFAVARPDNTRALGTAKRLGMEWVGETDKYYNMRLQVFRMRPADLDERS